MNLVNKILVFCFCGMMIFSYSALGKGISCPKKNDSTNGAFLGFYLGIGMARFNLDEPRETYSTNLGAFSPLVGVDFGYGKLYGKYYLALQADINNINRSAKSTKVVAYQNQTYKREDKVRESFSYGLNLQLGYNIAQNNILYGLGGVRVGYFNFKKYYFNYPSYSYAKKAYLLGAQFGVGDLMVLGEHTQLRFSFIVNNYGNKSVVSVNPYGSRSIKYMPYTLNTILDLDYRF